LLKKGKIIKAVFKTAIFFLCILILFILLGCGDADDDDTGYGDTADDDDDNEAGDDDMGDDDHSQDDDDLTDDDDDWIVPPVINEPPPWPEWTLRHWVWEDESTQESATTLVEDYLANDIPLGAIIIDSPWETGYNTFIFDQNLFADPQGMIDHLHDLDVRVFLWITANVNVDSPNYDEGLANDYYINDGRTFEWWKGEGSYIDFYNPDALDWWHGQIDNVLNLGIDGWKCDGSEFALILWFQIRTFVGNITWKEYQETYYRDFFEYTRQRLGNDRIITARPVDSYGVPVPWPPFATTDVNFAGWVGDQDPTWSGMKAALHNMLASAHYGYVYVGSDIAAYRDDGIRDKEIFIRWAQLGALCSIMENGGAGEHRPWMYDQETLDIYRKYTKLHHALIPYLYSVGATSYQQGVSVMRPTDKWRYEYKLGGDLFVAAMVRSGDSREVKFPQGDWIDFWDGSKYAGGSTATVDVPLDSYPLFVRKGAIIPMDFREGGVFDDHSGNLPPLTVHVYRQSDEVETFDLYEEHGEGAQITIAMVVGETMTISLSATERPYAFRFMDVDLPGSVMMQPDRELAPASDLASLTGLETGWFYDNPNRELWIKPGDASSGIQIEINW